MIHRIFSNDPRFKTITFDAGLNVIIADEALGADKKDSRNGLGKSSIVEIMHFCLGSDFPNSGTLSKGALTSWVFSCEMTIGGHRVTVSRDTSKPRIMIIEGHTEKWPIQPTLDEELSKPVFTTDAWKDLLGKLMFNLPLGPSKVKFGPTFRQLIAYFARMGRDGYTAPFEFRSHQAAYQTQVLNAYLLGLSWEYAVDWQNLKTKEDELKAIRKASQTGYFSDVIGSLGELEALKLRFEQKTQRESAQLASFQVHPQYKELETQANRLTQSIHELANDNMSDSRLIDYYEKALIEERAASRSDVELVYREVGIVFPEKVTKRLEEVVQFHDHLTKNREIFLREEVNKLKRAVFGRDDKKKRLSEERAIIFDVLKTHHALEEYTKLQEALNQSKAQLEDIKRRIELLKKFESGKSTLRIEKEELLQNTRRDYDERTRTRENAIALFNQCSETLYNRPGQLIINVTDNGYSFDVEIEREQSDGIRLMEIFCYDLVLAQLWAKKNETPGFIFHDSSIYADVDERQIASAIKFAEKVSRESGFQYICCLNSDKVPWELLKPDLDLKPFVRLELKDKPEKDCLFGFRF